MATGYVQHHRPSGANTTISRQSSMNYTLEDLHASIVRAGSRGAGMSNSGRTVESMTRHGLESMSPAGFPALGPAPCKPRRKHSRRQSSSKKGGISVPMTAAAVATASKAAAAVGVASEWVWGQGPRKVPTLQQQQQQQQQQRQREQAASNVADNNKPSDIQKMFAGSSSSSFESTCSTEALTVSNSSSPKDANFDDPFLNRLSDFSMRFPEPPTRPPPVATPPSSSSSKALAISGWGKNITSSIPSVQLLLPPSWRRRLRANGGNNKPCRKSTARWIARSKATSSMSETSLLARALSMNDTVSSQPYNRRGKETAAAEAAKGAVCHKSEPTPRLAELTELTELAEEQTRQPPPVLPEDGEGQEKEGEQQREEQQEEEMERLQDELEQQLQQLLLEREKDQQQQQQLHVDQPREETPRSVHGPLSALPTPFRFGDRAQLQHTPPPPPLWTAPRPPLSREQQRQQVSNATALLAARQSTNRRFYFGSSSACVTPKELGGSRCSSSRRSTKENYLSSWSASSPGSSAASQSPLPSQSSSVPAPPPSPHVKLINRLASSSSSIFEEEGDDSKKTKFLNPYVRLAPPPRAGASAARPAGAAAPPAKPLQRGPPRQTPSGTWVWGGRSPRASSPTTSAQQQQLQQLQEQQEQQRKNMFAMEAGRDSFCSNRRRRRAGLTALHVEMNRRDAVAYGDNRRRLRSGDSGIWLPSPGIWSSARRPTPLNGELSTAW